MNIINRKVSVLILFIVGFGFGANMAMAKQGCNTTKTGTFGAALTSAVTSLTSQGYTCTSNLTGHAGYCSPSNSGTMYGSKAGTSYDTVTCAKAVGTNFSANTIDAHTLQGFQNTAIDTQVFSNTITVNTYSYNSPFLYLHNPPAGNVYVSLDSKLEKYAPKPSFNQKNGWLLDSYGGSVSLKGVKVKNLFYELATNKLTLSRNGKNFSSKAEVVSFLKNSDFLSRMGLTKEQQKNSLNYFLPKIATTPNTPYYYLSILDKDSINEISSVVITPKPNRVDRQYFVLYPTISPVRTTGDFVFPAPVIDSGFVVQETGEFIVTPKMFVFFN